MPKTNKTTVPYVPKTHLQNTRHFINGAECSRWGFVGSPITTDLTKVTCGSCRNSPRYKAMKDEIMRGQVKKLGLTEDLLSPPPHPRTLADAVRIRDTTSPTFDMTQVECSEKFIPIGHDDRGVVIEYLHLMAHGQWRHWKLTKPTNNN